MVTIKSAIIRLRPASEALESSTKRCALISVSGNDRPVQQLACISEPVSISSSVAQLVDSKDCSVTEPQDDTFPRISWSNFDECDTPRSACCYYYDGSLYSWPHAIQERKGRGMLRSAAVLCLQEFAESSNSRRRISNTRKLDHEAPSSAPYLVVA